MIDFCNTNDAVVLDYELDLVLQQIDMLFDTNYKEVLGELEYGTDFEKFLYDINISNYQIEQHIQNSIIQNIDTLGFNIDTKVSLLNGTQNDIIIVTINISKDGKIYEQKYRIR